MAQMSPAHSGPKHILSFTHSSSHTTILPDWHGTRYPTPQTRSNRSLTDGHPVRNRSPTPPHFLFGAYFLFGAPPPTCIPFFNQAGGGEHFIDPHFQSSKLRTFRKVRNINRLREHVNWPNVYKLAAGPLRGGGGGRVESAN